MRCFSFVGASPERDRWDVHVIMKNRCCGVGGDWLADWMARHDKMELKGDCLGIVQPWPKRSGG
jgi:hypothetical protein